MTAADVLKDLVAAGYEVAVRSPYHVHILCADGGRHNLWFGKDGLKFQAHGQRAAERVTLGALKEHLRRYTGHRTDLAALAAVQYLVRGLPLTDGIFVDAGFKNGSAKIAAVRVAGGSVDVAVREVACADSTAAEVAAVALAAALFPGDDPIHTDCQGAVGSHPRARWIAREHNHMVDRLAHRRDRN